MTQWYYENQGEARGPIPEADLATLLADGMLPPMTRLWHQSFVQEWRPATQTQFKPIQPAASPAPAS